MLLMCVREVSEYVEVMEEDRRKTRKKENQKEANVWKTLGGK